MLHGTPDEGLVRPLEVGHACPGEVTVSFHDFKSQKFKLSVSNPKNKYVAYVSVLSQISNCQGLGRKNKHEILTTDRMVQLFLLTCIVHY